MQAVARTHLMRARSGAWGGVGGGRAHDGLASRGVVLAELGAWANAGSRSALATLSPTVVDDSLRFADAQVAARWLLSRGEVGAVLGYRAGDGLTSTIGENRAWGNASVTLWLTRAVALVGSAGNYPTDFTQGFPGGRFASISVRLASAGARPVTVAHGSRSTAVEQAERSATLDFAVARLPGGMQRFDVHAPGARRVEIMGDFSDWTPLVLRDAGKGRWTTTVPVARGTHQLNLRLDGGAWMVPPGLPILRDEFGGAVGLLSIQ